MDYTHATIEDIIDHAQRNGNVKALKEMASRKVGKRNISFFELRKLYFSRYLPEAIPVAKSKKITFYDKIKNL